MLPAPASGWMGDCSKPLKPNYIAFELNTPSHSDPTAGANPCIISDPRPKAVAFSLIRHPQRFGRLVGSSAGLMQF